MFYTKLKAAIEKKESRVCVGLDADLAKLPNHMPKTLSSVFDFNKAIIEATSNDAASYKINTAFYEALGSEGWEMLNEIEKLIPDDCITIADAKRGDIGNTSNKYAEAFFDTMNFDSITLSPYMGLDSIEPFMRFSDKGSIILTLTSNSGSHNFQKMKLENGKALYEEVADTVNSWHQEYKNCMMVVGATHSTELIKIRQIAKDIFFLVPGIGAQGGDLNTVLANCGRNVLINVSRSVIYASSSKDFAEAASREVKSLKKQINSYFSEEK